MRTAPSHSSRDAVRPAVVEALDDDPHLVHVRTASSGSRPRRAVARLALASPYRPTEGDRVLVAGHDGGGTGDDELYVIGVLHTKTPPTLPLPDGGTLRVIGDAAELRDAAGRLLIRYRDGAAEIAAPSGDLTLSAPAGRVVVRSAQDIELSATRDLVHRAGRDVEISAGPSSVADPGSPSPEPQLRITETSMRVEADRIEAESGESRIVTGQATILAQRIATTATVLVQQAERFELSATRLVEKTRDAFREVSDLAQTRVGRVRTIVADAYSLHAKRTTVVSTEETSIDGKKILLG